MSIVVNDHEDPKQQVLGGTLVHVDQSALIGSLLEVSHATFQPLCILADVSMYNIA